MVLIQGTDTASLQKGPGPIPKRRSPARAARSGSPVTAPPTWRPSATSTRWGRATWSPRDALRALPLPGAEDRVVDPGDVGVVSKVGYERLVLSACNPLYSAEQRFIVFARLVGERPVAGAAGG